MSQFRQLPDGTLLDTTTNTVSAPLGAEPDASAVAPGMGTKVVAIGAIIGVAALTVWLQSRKKAKQAKKLAIATNPKKKAKKAKKPKVVEDDDEDED